MDRTDEAAPESVRARLRRALLEEIHAAIRAEVKSLVEDQTRFRELVRAAAADLLREFARNELRQP